MTTPNVSIKLYGSKAERFRELADAIEESTGVEPSNPDVVMELLKQCDENRLR